MKILQSCNPENKMPEPGFVRLKDNRIGKIKKYNDKWFPLV
jgi:hypothetical protein